VADTRDYYAILQVNRNASQDQIERAYERLSKQFDPKTSRKPRAAQRFADIQEAYDVLGSREKRREYDKTTRRGEREVAGSLMPSEVLSRRFLVIAGGTLIASVIAVVGIILLFGGDGDEDPLATTSVTPTAIPTLPQQSPTTAPESPTAVEGEPDLLESGVGYIDVIVGQGKEAETGEMVAVNYTGWLEESGELFITTVGESTPDRVVLGDAEVVRGLEEGILGMRKGGLRRLFVPAELGYGAEGNADLGVPGNADLIYDVSLVDILDPFPTPTPEPTPTPPMQSPGVAPASPPEVAGEEVTLDSGLIYIDVEAGAGETAETGDLVAMNYTGWLEATGVKFDSSLERAATYPVLIGTGGVIQGWDLGLPGMREGGVRRLIIPPELAYGDTGQGSIPANSTLIFDVELVDVLAKGLATPRPTFTPTPTPTAVP
jgi:peptidylprolyl isomerase